MRTLVVLALLCSGCASLPAQVTVLPGPDIWITQAEADSTRVCVELTYEQNSLWKYRCVNVRDLRAIINGIGTTN